MLTNNSFEDKPGGSYLSRVKDVKERLRQNLTTPQLLGIYESYLDNAIAPVVSSTNFFDSFLPRVLVWQAENFRRKVSFSGRQQVPALVLDFFGQTTAEGRMKSYRSLRLDRGIRTEFLELFLAGMHEYELACNLKLPGRSLEEMSFIKYDTEARYSNGAPLSGVIREARFWLQAAYEFKSLLMEKYVRLCVQTAEKDHRRFFSKTGHQVTDLVQLYSMAAARAVDKCSHELGALTSHIQNWLLTARANVNGRRQDTRSQEMVSIHDDERMLVIRDSTQTIEESLVSKSEVEAIRMIAKIVDPLGASRLALGIPEILSMKDLHGKDS